MKPLLLAVFCAALAGPAAAAQTETAPVPAVKHGIPKFDFTLRPKLRPHPERAPRDASKVMTEKEGRALAEDLFAGYLNIGSLTRFRFHKRTKDEAPMTADELGWVETELKDEMALAEKLAPEAEMALKTGIERPEPWPKDSKYKDMKFARLRAMSIRLAVSNKPTYEDQRMYEHYAMGSIMDNLWTLVDIASSREDDAEEDAKAVAETRAHLSVSYASLASARKGMLAAAKESEALRKDEAATADAARKRAEKVAGPKGGSTAKGADALGVRDSGARITPEEAAAEANAVEQRAANKKSGRSPAIVPAP